MISWIIATNNMQRLQRNHHALLQDNQNVDQIVIVEDAESITKAYDEGQRRALKPVRVFVHDDVEILDLDRLRRELVAATATAALVGVIGSRTSVIPWWNGDVLGSVQDRGRTLDYGPGGPCAVVDGLLLATRQQLPWDVTFPGWHMYDADICRQLSDAMQQVWCLTAGSHLLRHNSDSPFSLDAIDGWSEAVNRYQEKWSP